jgi:hypothetical protein
MNKAIICFGIAAVLFGISGSALFAEEQVVKMRESIIVVPGPVTNCSDNFCSWRSNSERSLR